MGNINSKSKKEDILEALRDAEAEVIRLKSTTVSSSDLHKQDTIQAVVDKVDARVKMVLDEVTGNMKTVMAIVEENGTITDVVAPPVEEDVEDTVTKIVDFFRDLDDKCKEKEEQYVDTCLALTAKQAELEKIYSIEVNANTLETFVIANTIAIEKAEAEAKAKKETLDAEIAVLEAKKTDTEAEITQLRNDYEAALTKQKETDKTEWAYELTRTKKLDNDLWDDLKKTRLAELVAKESVVANRESAIASKETDFKDLLEQIAKIPDQVAKASKDGEAKGKAIAESKALTDAQILAAQVKGAQDLANAKISALEAQLADEKAKNTDLNTKLQESYVKIESIAKATVENKNQNETMATLQKALSEKSNSK